MRARSLNKLFCSLLGLSALLLATHAAAFDNLRRLPDGYIFDKSATGFRLFDHLTHEVKTFNATGALLSSKVLTDIPNAAIGDFAPTRVLDNKWLLDGRLYTNDFSLIVDLYSTPSGDERVCRDGKILRRVHERGSEDVVIRGNMYVATGRNGLTFYDANFECVKRVLAIPRKYGPNSGFHRDVIAPRQLTQTNAPLYFKDVFIHYIVSATGQNLIWGAMTENGMRALTPDEDPVNFDSSDPVRLASGSVVIGLPIDGTLVFQTLYPNASFGPVYKIPGPFVNDSYRLKSQPTATGGVMFTFSEWVITFDANGHLLGRRSFGSPVISAAINRDNRVALTTVGDDFYTNRLYATDITLASVRQLSKWMVNPDSPTIPPSLATVEFSSLAPWGNGFIGKIWYEGLAYGYEHRLGFLDAAGRISPMKTSVPVLEPTTPGFTTSLEFSPLGWGTYGIIQVCENICYEKYAAY
jgi:hypothetical protein